MKRLASFISAIALLLSFSPLIVQTASGLDGSDFKAGNIISDSNFFNSNALTQDEIQQFLEAKMPVCDTDGSEMYNSTQTRAQYGASRGYPAPYTCLKSYKQKIPAKNPEELLCSGMSATDTKRLASEIIYKVGQSCGVSQKVLLVLLQKEQSLVTDDWPWSIQYRSATGFGCPDTAPCDSEYYGFFNQVYHAARIYKYYAKYPDSFNHIAGENNFVRYHPNSSCGGKTVFIQNQSTAGLYNYTPYQPNPKALENLYTTGNSCSAYGNRNFWRLYSDWFGSTTTEPYPKKTLIGDWNGDGKDSIGVKRGNEYFLDNDGDGEADIEFAIGRATDKAIVGDWNGDGKDSIGLRRGVNYYLDNDFDNSAEIYFDIGRATDKAIVGDWDNDGKDELGLWRGKQYFLDLNTDGAVETTFAIGRDTDMAMVGDWDGDGKDSIGLRRGAQYYLDNDFDRSAEVYFAMGRSTDAVLVGDWDGDGKDAVGLKRESSFYIDNTRDGVADHYLAIGRDTDVGIIGNWNGDAKDDIGLKRYSRYYFDTDLNGTANSSLILPYY